MNRVQVGQLVGDVFAGLFIVTVLYILVRPQSVASQAVDAMAGAAVALVRRATT
jgi:hypothetical protein